MRLEARVVVNDEEVFNVPVGDGRQTVLWLALNIAGRWGVENAPKGRMRQREAIAVSGPRGQLVPVDVQLNGQSVNPHATILQVLRNIRRGQPHAHSLDLAIHGDYELVALQLEQKEGKSRLEEGKCGKDSENDEDGRCFESKLGDGDNMRWGTGKKRIVDIAKQVSFHISLATQMHCAPSGVPYLQHTHWRDVAFGHSDASKQRINAVREDKLRQKAAMLEKRRREKEEANRAVFMKEIGERVAVGKNGRTVLEFYSSNEDELGSTAMHDYKYLHQKIERLAEDDPEEVARIRKIMLSHYRLLRNAYKYYSGLGSGDGADAMSFLEFTHVILDTHVVEARDMDLVANIVTPIFHNNDAVTCASVKRMVTDDKNSQEDEEEDSVFSWTQDDSHSHANLTHEESDDESESFDDDNKGGEFKQEERTKKRVGHHECSKPRKGSLMTQGYIRRLDFFECIMAVFLNEKLHRVLQSKLGNFADLGHMSSIAYASMRLDKYMQSFVIPRLENKTHTHAVRKALQNEEVLCVFVHNIKPLKNLFVEMCVILTGTNKSKEQRQKQLKRSGYRGMDQEDNNTEGLGQEEFTLLLQSADLVELSGAERQQVSREAKMDNKDPASYMRRCRPPGNFILHGTSTKCMEEDAEKRELWPESEWFLEGRVEKAKLRKLTLADTRGLFTISQFEDEDQLSTSTADAAGYEELSFKEFIAAVVRLAFMLFSEHYATDEIVSHQEKVKFILDILLLGFDKNLIALEAS